MIRKTLLSLSAIAGLLTTAGAAAQSYYDLPNSSSNYRCYYYDAYGECLNYSYTTTSPRSRYRNIPYRNPDRDYTYMRSNNGRYDCYWYNGNYRCDDRYYDNDDDGCYWYNGRYLCEDRYEDPYDDDDYLDSDRYQRYVSGDCFMRGNDYYCQHDVYRGKERYLRYDEDECVHQNNWMYCELF